MHESKECNQVHIIYIPEPIKHTKTSVFCYAVEERL